MFKCKGSECKSSCCGVFNGTTSNLKTLEGHHLSEIPIHKKSFEYIKKLGKVNNTYFDKNKNINYIRLNGDKSCPFHVEGNCEIWDEKPFVCSAYPFYIDMFAGLCVDKNCEGVTDNDNYNENKMELKAVKQAYKIHL